MTKNKIKKADKRKIKYSKMPMEDFSAVWPFVYLPLLYPTSVQVWSLIWTVLKDFFFLQIKQKLHLSHRPVIYVDTEIDEKIPFTPKYVKDYMSFVGYFVKPLDMLKKRLGYRKAAHYISVYVKFLNHIYKNAAKIYRFCLTTTTRPKYLKNQKFRTIHFFDPHLLCVPSIHVCIATGVYAWFKQFFKIGIFPEDEVEFRLKELREHSIKIVESVLFIKQHSVNCVPLAMYMMTSTMNKSFFSTQDAVDFIDELFVNCPEIKDEDKKEITRHFHYMYERALLENCYSDDWQSCIKHWLIDYAKKTGQNLN